MAAFIPNRKDAAVTETALAKVREDKERECGDGFDGTWVAHPDLVSIAREPFDQMLGDKPHQKERLREDVDVTTEQLLDFHVPGGCITEVGLRNNIGVGVQYLDAWLRGSGAVAIHNLMEDAATAEISRSQLWQWVHHPKAILDDGRRITVELYLSILAQDQKANSLAAQILDRLIMDPDFADFLTLPAYEHLD
jgi:malate synthase